MPDLKLYNSLSRQKEVFKPIDPAHVKVYACGPTVYSYAHIGNARMAVVFDVLVRVLKSLYPKVTYVSNITDIEDKIIDAAKAAGVPISEITEKYTRIYNEDMASLGVMPPDIQPKATGHIEEMIALIEALISNNMAYENDGHVLFNVPAYKNYGRLSGRSRDEQIAGARVDIAPYKKDPADFVLWKPSSDDQPGWESPWGFGRPGWHIECSAMAEKHLGLPFDIHGGGADLKFPHHENEIAQSCGAHHIAPEDFARVWVHNGFVTVEGEKMSKSIGNVMLAHDLIEDYPGEVLRLTLLSSHYRQPLDWTKECLMQNKKLLDKMYGVLRDAAFVPQSLTQAVPDEIMAALDDDLNTPKVLSVLNSMMKEETDHFVLAAKLYAVGQLIGLLGDSPEAWFGRTTESVCAEDAALIDSLLKERQDARAAKNFARADEIRLQLEAMRIVVEDGPNGAIWRKV